MIGQTQCNTVKNSEDLSVAWQSAVAITHGCNRVICMLMTARELHNTHKVYIITAKRFTVSNYKQYIINYTIHIKLSLIHI